MPVFHGCPSFQTYPGPIKFALGFLVVLGAMLEPHGLRGLVKPIYQSPNSEKACVQLTFISYQLEVSVGDPDPLALPYSHVQGLVELERFKSVHC